MNEKQKNQAMVNAFGTGKPPVATVRRRGEARQQQRARGQGVDPNSDIDAVFRGIQQIRTKVHKGLSGMPLNPDGTDPGNSFDRFMRQNPHLQGAAQRQAQYDQQAKNNLQANLQSAIVERKALQEMQNQNPNLVKGADGYMTLFDGQGKVIGTTKPLQSKAMWSQDDAINRGTASPDERRDFANTLQNAGMSSVASKIQGPKLPANMSTLFPGKSSPPGGGQGDRVGSSNPSGEPGGETLFGQMPNVQGEGMPLPQQPTVAQAASPYDFPLNAGPQYTPMMPNDGPAQMYPFQYGNMAQPAYGTLAEKETARRNAERQSGGALKGVLGQAGAEASNILGSVGNSLKWLFGDPNSQVRNVAPQVFNDNNPAQQLNRLEALLTQSQQAAIQRNQQNLMAQLMDRLNAMMYR